jgi:hypothetical protein
VKINEELHKFCCSLNVPRVIKLRVMKFMEHVGA